MMPTWEVPIGNSRQMILGHFHSRTEWRFGIEPQPFSRYPHLRFQTLRCERSLPKLVSVEIAFMRVKRNRQIVERVSAHDEMYRLRLTGSSGILVETFGRGRK
jgi:hypothetical protein